MQRISGGAAAVTLVVIVALGAALRPDAFGKEAAPAAPRTAPTDSASVAAGAKIFAKYCETCHGKSGHGDGPASKPLNPKPRDFTNPKNFKSKNDEEVFSLVSKGGASRHLSPVMPAWGSTLKKEQIWQVIGYVRGFPERDSIAKASAAK
jgi:mono/diheme cytochrome c family protein